jgi:hypothetical protein
VLANPCTESNTLSRRVDFADLGRARHLLGARDAWARQLSDFDLGARQKTAAPTSLHQFLAFAENAALAWTPQDQSGWQALLDKLSGAMKGLNLHLPDIDLVKTTGNEEFGAAYTRERAIMFPQSIVSAHLSNPRGVYFLLAHELFHVLSREDSRLRDGLYALLGFRNVKRFEYPRELGLNPDTRRPFSANPRAPVSTVGCSRADASLVDLHQRSVRVSPESVRWIYNNNTAARIFGTPFGAGRNVLRSPAAHQIDLSIFRSVPLSERVTLQLRLEAENAFNHPNLGIGGSIVNLPGFLNPAETHASPRRLAAGLRLVL